MYVHTDGHKTIKLLITSKCRNKEQVDHRQEVAEVSDIRKDSNSPPKASGKKVYLRSWVVKIQNATRQKQKSYLGWSSLVPRCVAKPTDMSVLTQPRVGNKLKQDDSNRNETLTLKGTIRLASDWVSNHISWAVHKCSNIGQGYHLDGRPRVFGSLDLKNKQPCPFSKILESRQKTSSQFSGSELSVCMTFMCSHNCKPEAPSTGQNLECICKLALPCTPNLANLWR